MLKKKQSYTSILPLFRHDLLKSDFQMLDGRNNKATVRNIRDFMELWKKAQVAIVRDLSYVRIWFRLQNREMEWVFCVVWF